MTDISDETLDASERFHRGHIWSEVRWGLSRYRERLVAAFDAGSYGRESAVLDAVARDITATIEPLVETYARRLAERRK